MTAATTISLGCADKTGRRFAARSDERSGSIACSAVAY
jgi:hypothetical protein